MRLGNFADSCAASSRPVRECRRREANVGRSRAGALPRSGRGGWACLRCERDREAGRRTLSSVRAGAIRSRSAHEEGPAICRADLLGSSCSPGGSDRRWRTWTGRSGSIECRTTLHRNGCSATSLPFVKTPTGSLSSSTTTVSARPRRLLPVAESQAIRQLARPSPDG